MNHITRLECIVQVTCLTSGTSWFICQIWMNDSSANTRRSNAWVGIDPVVPWLSGLNPIMDIMVDCWLRQVDLEPTIPELTLHLGDDDLICCCLVLLSCPDLLLMGHFLSCLVGTGEKGYHRPLLTSFLDSCYQICSKSVHSSCEETHFAVKNSIPLLISYL
jgi:hypothetical protein